MKQGTQSRCTGTTLRDGVGKEVGGGFRMGVKYLFHKLPNNYLNPVTNPSLWFSDFKGCKNDLGNL